MGETSIEWTDRSWNPGIYGCSIESDGCLNCYAAEMAKRLAAMGRTEYAGVTRDRTGRGAAYNGVVRVDLAGVPANADRSLPKKKPGHVFVTSMADMFHADVPFAFVDAVFSEMERRPWLTFQVLTKRTARAAEYAADRARRGLSWPRNVWMGTTVENQEQTARIPFLLSIPAPVRFLSVEPMLSAVDLTRTPLYRETPTRNGVRVMPETNALSAGPDLSWRRVSWVIAGCESGARRRPTDPAWLRSLRDQCVVEGIPFFLKQMDVDGVTTGTPELDGRTWTEMPKPAPSTGNLL